MAWTCSGRTNVELIDNMVKAKLITSARVATAMKKVDRRNYALKGANAYEDSPQSIGHGATISAPHMHAHAAEYLLPFLKPGSKVLDVGSGSGYTCAIFHHLTTDDEAGIQGRVVGIDHVPELVTQSEKNLRQDGLGGSLDGGAIQLVAGDGRLGLASSGPYDAIHVGAAAARIPDALIAQMASPGRMFIPVGTYSQDMIQVDKDADGTIRETQLFGVRYVPLTDRSEQTG